MRHDELMIKGIIAYWTGIDFTQYTKIGMAYSQLIRRNNI